MEQPKKLNILVCGSKKFDDSKFVFGILDQLYYQTKGNIGQIYTSNFSGTCEFAKQWIAYKNVELGNIAKEHNLKNPPFIKERECTFDMLLQERNQSIYEQLVIPEFIVKNDPFFQKGKDLIIQHGINTVLAFPNPSGELGAATHNIRRFSELAGIGDLFMDCSLAVKQVIEKKEERKQEIESSNTGFKNQHPGKKI